MTEICDVGSTERGDLLITVMDTPGLADTKGRDDVIGQLITRSLLAVHPGPHAVILCIRCDDRFTEMEYKVFQALKDIFGEKMTSYLIVVFVGADSLLGVTFEDQLKDHKSTRLKSLLQEADNRYVLFNNRGDQFTKNQQVNRLLIQVKSIVIQNGRECFKHKVAPEIGATVDRLVEEEAKQSQLGDVRGLQGAAPPRVQSEAEAEVQARETEKDVEDLKQAGNVRERLKMFRAPAQEGASSGPPPKIHLPTGSVKGVPQMTLEQKQAMVERVLKKAVKTPDRLNSIQRRDLDKASKTIGQKIKDGMAKFGAAITDCSIL